VQRHPEQFPVDASPGRLDELKMGGPDPVNHQVFVKAPAQLQEASEDPEGDGPEAEGCSGSHGAILYRAKLLDS